VLFRSVTARRAGWQLSAKFFCFVSSLLREVPEDANEVREGLDIFLMHRENGEDLAGGTSEMPNLKESAVLRFGEWYQIQAVAFGARNLG
jgi:hypothetical protein